VASRQRRLLEPIPEPARVSEGVLADGMATQAPRIRQLANQWNCLQRLSEADALYTAEIVKVLLHFGRSSHRPASLAAELFGRFGSLGGVVAAEPARLREVLSGDNISVMLLKAVHRAVMATAREPLEDRPVIDSSSSLMKYLAVAMRHEPTETMRILYLDRDNVLTKDEIHQRGTVDFTPIYPREIVKRAVELRASALILVHNHLSGDPKPSRMDIKMTRELAKALRIISVALHDHIIISREGEISFRELELL
jgi:DNA repair protein RadC